MMIPVPSRLHAASVGSLTLLINEAGGVYEIKKDRLQLNAYKSPSFAPGPFEIYLRVRGKGEAYPLLRGVKSLFQYPNGFRYVGAAGGLSYTLDLILASDRSYRIRIVLQGIQEGCDLLLVHDLGLADEGAIANNELYASQYVDHHVVSTPFGFAILSRQNLGKPNPGLAIGSTGLKAIRYATDLLQFYGPESRLTGAPKLLLGDLPNLKRQYEMGAALLQTELFAVQGTLEAGFYGLLSADEPTCYDRAPTNEEVAACAKAVLVGVGQPLPLAVLKAAYPFCLLEIADFNESELAALYPEALQKEESGGRTLSFFLKDGTHFVTKEKEGLSERPHGNLLYRFPKKPGFEQDSFTLTGYMYGLFAAQTAIGNTSLNKLTPVNRGLLDIPRNLGLRILVRVGESYRLLGVPSLFEMGFNYSRWIYKTVDDVLSVTVAAAHKANVFVLTFQSRRKISYEPLVIFEAVLGEGERLVPFEREERSKGCRYAFGEGTFFKSRYPKLSFDLAFSRPMSLETDGIFYEDGASRLPALQVFALKACSDFRLRVSASLDGETPGKAESFAQEKAYAIRALSRCLSSFHLASPQASTFAEKANLMLPWFASGALIHYLVPHGLEQSGGAAWGTRDVCQGPYEFFGALGHFEETRKILLETFAHQFSTTGEWPQWFMLDRYGFAADDSHGDVIFWPLKILGDYLRKTSDLPLLDKRLRFQNQKTPLSLKKHVALALSAIEKRFIFGTDFLSYGGGDWDDTLQPADPSLKERLVSPWTQELAYQTLQALGEVLPRSYGERQKSLELAGRLKKGYDQSFVREGAIPGFLYVGADGKLESLVDANDEKTGIHCRLLPYTRAIISTLASPQQAQGFSALIEDKLAFPDGVRLMDVPARYDGGVSHLFVRAEEAANVGREISLCYVHADIRYAESMCVLGEAEKAFRALEKIIPIHLDEVVPNAAVRQSNVYFSSSDPDFPDRYAFAAGIESLRRGEVAVRGGWRVYSSGNGIFIARLLGDLFGLRPGLSTLIIDPVLPKEFDGSSLIVSFGGHRYEFRYHLGPKGFGLARLEIKGTPVKGLPLANPYRPAGSEFSYADLPSGVVDIFTL